MPSNWLYIDTNFPTFTGEESTNEKIGTIQNYLFMLVEQLRYTLHNLDLDNMNKTAVERYEKYLTDPLYARIEDNEGNISELWVKAGELGGHIENVEGDLNDFKITADGYFARVESAEGQITNLWVKAGELGGQISNVSGDLNTFKATAEGYFVRLVGSDGDINDFEITADGFFGRIKNAEGNIHTLTSTADQLTSDMYDQGGRVSTVDQRIDSITLGVVNGTTSSTIQLTATGIKMQSAEILFSGVVTFINKYSTTTIDGGRITTGTITANEIAIGAVTGSKIADGAISGTKIANGAITTQKIGAGAVTANEIAANTITSSEIAAGAITSGKIAAGAVTAGAIAAGAITAEKIAAGAIVAGSLKGETVGLLTSWGESIGGITITGTQSWSGYGLEIYTSSGNGGIRIDTGSGAFWVDANGGVSYFGGSLGVSSSGITCGGDTVPFSNDKYSLGGGGLKWSDVYASNGTIQTSDRNQKTDIEALPEKYLTLFDGIQPVRFRRVDGTSGRYHTGFVAQQVKEAMDAAGVDSLELAAYVEDRDQEGNDIFMLRYEELIALLWAKVKRLEQQING